MLDKQIYKLYIEYQPLVAKILKAKYYPNQDILKAKVGRNPNYL